MKIQLFKLIARLLALSFIDYYYWYNSPSLTGTAFALIIGLYFYEKSLNRQKLRNER